MKAFLRCGMKGRARAACCGLTVTELIAAAAQDHAGRGQRYRLRPPVKPITLCRARPRCRSARPSARHQSSR